MSGPKRASGVGDQIRVEIADLLAREVHDPGIGFLTITYVKVTSDLQQARVYYTTMGDEKARRESQRALDRAAPFLRRQLGRRLSLRRVPDLQFFSTPASSGRTGSSRSCRTSMLSGPSARKAAIPTMTSRQTMSARGTDDQQRIGSTSFSRLSASCGSGGSSC